MNTSNSITSNTPTKSCQNSPVSFNETKNSNYCDLSDKTSVKSDTISQTSLINISNIENKFINEYLNQIKQSISWIESKQVIKNKF